MPDDIKACFNQLPNPSSDEVRECFPETKSGIKEGGKYQNNWMRGTGVDSEACYGDSGNASRFFKSIIYQAKASKSERNKGCEGLEEKRKKVAVIQTKGVANDGEWEDGKQLSSPMKNNHPTVKPVALMEYLIRMVSREGATVLDPFMGSGTTGVACVNLNRKFIGIELDPEYLKIAERRINGNL